MLFIWLRNANSLIEHIASNIIQENTCRRNYELKICYQKCHKLIYICGIFVKMSQWLQLVSSIYKVEHNAFRFNCSQNS